jgi:hypothetical protein
VTRAPEGRRWLGLAGAIAGFSLHVHVLNLVFVPCLIGYVLADRSRRGWPGAALAFTVGAGLLLLGQQLRFGDPLETGRFGHYSEFVAPWEGLLAQAIAPGRSFLLYSPAVLLGLCGWAALRRRAPAALWFAVAVVVLRWVVISTRSDWFGGWGLGPRHLVPVIPVAMLGFAAAIEQAPAWRPSLRRAWWVALGLAATLSGWLAVHSIFEWMWRLLSDPRVGDRGLMHVSHWAPWASPIAGFAELRPDVLALGSMLLASLGHPGLLLGFVAIAVVAVVAGWRVVSALRS